MEFCDPEEFEIILATDQEHYEVFRLKDLLPMGFGPGNLAEGGSVQPTDPADHLREGDRVQDAEI